MITIIFYERVTVLGVPIFNFTRCNYGCEVGPLSIKNYLTPGVINMEFEIRMGKTELFLTIRTNYNNIPFGLELHTIGKFIEYIKYSIIIS